MNIKQKLTYMLIGCLFTLAGFIVSSLFNTPTHVQAQDEKKVVHDRIVCKQLEIVNSEGITMIELTSFLSMGGGGHIVTYNRAGNRLVSIEATVNGDGHIDTNNRAGKRLVSIGAAVNGDGTMTTYNAGNKLVSIGATGKGGDGHIATYNQAGKELVYIGVVRGRPNDGLINIYNYEGEWRSFSAD